MNLVDIIKKTILDLEEIEPLALPVKARIIATIAHANQQDKASKPYYLHLDFVANDPTFTDEEKAAGYLHDIIEDTEITEGNLRGFGIPNLVIKGVVALSKSDGPYFDSIENGLSDPIFRKIKPRDNFHNSDLSRLPADFTPSQKLQDKWDFVYPLCAAFVRAADAGAIGTDCTIVDFVKSNICPDELKEKVTSKLSSYTSHNCQGLAF